jgi:predicted chitinase/chitodextrinase
MLRPRILAPLCALAVTGALAIIIPITSASAATCTAPTWNAATAYTGGAQVSYNNHQYTAKWWSQGHRPDQYSGPDDEWRDNGACSGGTPPPPPGGGGGNCNYPDWAAGRTYHAGDVVRYPNNGRYYKASHDNPGYDPTISTWYWDPFSCDGGGDPPPPPPGGSPGGFVVSEAQFNQMFPGRNSFYTYSGLTSAMSAYAGFAKTGSDTVRKQEAAAFLANVSHETGGLVYIVEQNTGNYPHYCDASQPYGCPAGQAAYYGRGPIQLSWNFNYKAAGDALGIDLLHNPYQVEQNAAVAWKTGLWYWMTQTGPGTMTPHNAMVGGAGFGETIRSINGSLECNGRNPAQVQSRINNYQRFTQILGVPTGGNLSC